ncbi:MAG: hypothetical protein ACTHU0_30130 [Kofleriaceae bacterium]
MTRYARLAVLALLGLVMASPARADTVTVGLFAPSAPFPSTASRVELASRLGDHLGKALGGTGVGRVYARSGDFAAAVKKGDVSVALVDAAYLAGTTGYTVIAASVRGGEVTQGWQLVARGAKKIGELRGKRVLVPSNGGHETDFVLHVLLGGVDKDFFGKIESAPDTASALAAIGLGKADAVVVPAGVELPAGTAQVLALPSIATPLLVAYGSISPQQRTALASAASSFRGDATVAGFRGGDADGVRAIARRFGAPVKRGPFVVPAVRLVVGDLVETRSFSIERTPVTTFAILPGAR